MKKPLLSILLLVWTVALARAQEWAGGLPVDSASGQITYRGWVEAKGVSAAILSQRAKAYTYQAYAQDTATVFIKDIYRVGGRPDLDCQVVIQVANGSYRYELSKFKYFTRGGEAFGIGGEITHISPNYFTPAEERLRVANKQRPTNLQACQAEIAEAAAKAITEMQAAMQ